MKELTYWYCQNTIATIEKKRNQLIQKILKYPNRTYLYQYLEKYDRLLLKQYLKLEKFLKENES